MEAKMGIIKKKLGRLITAVIISINVSAARDSVIENKTKDLFVVNGTTGNIPLAHHLV